MVWDGWDDDLAEQGPVFICPPPKQSCCVKCGSVARPVVNRGRVARVPAVTHEAIAEADAARARLPWKLRHKVKAKALYRLHVFRCPDCQHDQVLDMDSNEFWDLEPIDYGDEGSLDPETDGVLF